MVRAALRWEISRLRVSSKRFPSAPYRHASPLEMTMLASAPLVISTVAERSGEIPPDGTGGITLGDLSTQSIIKAFSICPIPTCISARDDDVGERPSRHFDRSEAEWRNLTPPWYRKHWGGRSLDSEFHRSGSPLTPIPAHPPPLEMTMLASAPLVISTVAERSGEISRLNDQESGCGFRRRLCRRGYVRSAGGGEKVLKIDRPTGPEGS